MAATISCPQCKSAEVRHSRWRRQDGLMRRLLSSAYRCRACRARFWRFDAGNLVVLVAVVVTLGAAVAGGWALHELQQPDAEPAADVSTGSAPGPPAALAPVARSGPSEHAAPGEARAQASLALAYLNGQGVSKDMAQALKWAEKSARQGDVEGQYTLASMYLAGRGTLQNFQAAFEWFDKAARQNHAEAQYRLGAMYRSGHGVALDKAKAYVWFSLAAAQGHQRAAEDRDSLLNALPPEEIALAQREAQAWRPSAAQR